MFEVSYGTMSMFVVGILVTLYFLLPKQLDKIESIKRFSERANSSVVGIGFLVLILAITVITTKILFRLDPLSTI